MAAPTKRIAAQRCEQRHWKWGQCNHQTIQIDSKNYIEEIEVNVASGSHKIRENNYIDADMDPHDAGRILTTQYERE